jgi:hypothetical protein
MPVTMFDPVPMEIVDAGERILIRVQEYDVERVIHMNPGAPSPAPSPLGHSVGRWDGETLVVTTTRVDWPQANPYGTPQSNRVSFVERFRFLPQNAALHYTITVTDPEIFTRPMTFERTRPWTPGVELVPFNCAASWGTAPG